jgi:hypothetical protein
MPTAIPTSNNMEQQLAAIASDLKEIRNDVSAILHSLQDELDAFREREFWRDYSESYHQE